MSFQELSKNAQRALDRGVDTALTEPLNEGSRLPGNEASREELESIRAQPERETLDTFLPPVADTVSLITKQELSDLIHNGNAEDIAELIHDTFIDQASTPEQETQVLSFTSDAIKLAMTTVMAAYKNGEDRFREMKDKIAAVLENIPQSELARLNPDVLLTAMLFFRTRIEGGITPKDINVARRVDQNIEVLEEFLTEYDLPLRKKLADALATSTDIAKMLSRTTLSEDELVTFSELIAETFSRTYDIPVPEIILTKDDPENGYASYAAYRIGIDIDFNSDPANMLETVLHELRHLMQHTMSDGVRGERSGKTQHDHALGFNTCQEMLRQAKAFLASELVYKQDVETGGYATYYYSQLERDAREFAADIIKRSQGPGLGIGL